MNMLHFTKMHGLGNDYLYVYGEPQNPQALSQKLSDRHFGAGADGMIWISPSKAADFKMRIFNADGSEANMCGNGIRCVGKYVYDKGLTSKTRLTIETLAGPRTLALQIENGKAVGAAVDMGTAQVGDTLSLSLDGALIACTPVDMGNPHAVLFVEDMAAAPLSALGPQIERHPAFPGGVNVEFVQVLGPGRLRMRVWERGSGITLACGTGACACVAAAAAMGHCPKGRPVLVELDGGTLQIEIDEKGAVVMTGPAVTVYEGEVELC